MSRTAAEYSSDTGFQRWLRLRQTKGPENRRLNHIDENDLGKQERRYKSYIKFTDWLNKKYPNVDVNNNNDDAYLELFNEYAVEQDVIRTQALKEIVDRRRGGVDRAAVGEVNQAALTLQSLARGFLGRRNKEKLLAEKKVEPAPSQSSGGSESRSSGPSSSDPSSSWDPSSLDPSNDGSSDSGRDTPAIPMLVPGNLKATREVAANRLKRFFLKKVRDAKAEVEALREAQRPKEADEQARDDDTDSLHSGADSNKSKSEYGDEDENGAEAERGLGGNGKSKGVKAAPINLANLKQAFVNMSKGEWPRRLSIDQYKAETSYLNNAGQAFPNDHKLRPILGPDGGIVRFEEVGKTEYTVLQNKYVEGIRGDISHVTQNIPDKYKPRTLKEYAAENANDNILMSWLGESYAQYYSPADLQAHVTNAAKHYSAPENRLTSEDDFRKTYVRLYDQGEQKDCEITVTSQGVTLAFIKPSIIHDRYEKKFSEFCDKVAEDLGNGQLMTNGEKMMYMAMEKVGIEPLSDSDLKAALDGMKDDVERDNFTKEYERKISEAERLVRSWSREHVMHEIQKETEVAMAYQRAQQPTLEDYRSIERAFGQEPKGRQSLYEQELAKQEAASTKVTGSKSVESFRQAKFALLNTPNPVCINPGVAFGYSEISDSVVKILFNYQPDITGPSHQSLTTAYVHLPGTYECYVKVEFFPKTGEIKIEPNTFYHASYDEKGNKNYKPLKVGKDKVQGSSRDAIKKAYKGMIIQATAQNGPNRNMVIMGGDEWMVKKDLGKVAVLDEKKEAAIFTKRLQPKSASPADISAFEKSAWDPQEIFMKCPDLGIRESELVIQEKYGVSEAEVKELIARQAKVYMKTCIATKDGYVQLNDGKSIYVKEGEVYSHPLPYLDEKGTKLCEKPYDIRAGLGEQFMAQFLQVKPSCKVVNQYEAFERKLREACRNCTGSTESIEELKKAVAALERHLATAPSYEKINLNAKDPTNGKTIMHYAAENVNIPKDLLLKIMALKDPAKTVKLSDGTVLDLGIDFSKRSDEFNSTSLSTPRRYAKSLLEFTGHDKRWAEVKEDWSRVVGNGNFVALMEKVILPMRNKSGDRAMLKEKREYEKGKAAQPFMAQNSGHTPSSQARKAGQFELAHILQLKEIDSMRANIVAEIKALKESKTQYETCAQNLEQATTEALNNERTNALAKGASQKIPLRDTLYNLVNGDTKEVVLAIKDNYTKSVDSCIVKLEAIAKELETKKKAVGNSGFDAKPDKDKKEELKTVSQFLRDFQNRIDGAKSPVEKAEEKIDEKIEFVIDRMHKFGVQEKNPEAVPKQPLHVQQLTHLVEQSTDPRSFSRIPG